jgi:hypothetical protein
VATVEKRRAEAVRDGADVAGEGRLREVAPLGGAREKTGIAHCTNIFELIKTHVLGWPSRL